MVDRRRLERVSSQSLKGSDKHHPHFPTQISWKNKSICDFSIIQICIIFLYLNLNVIVGFNATNMRTYLHKESNVDSIEYYTKYSI